MKKFWIILLLVFLCLGGALVWEYFYQTSTEEQQLKKFEKRLHREEERVDKLLQSLDLSKGLDELAAMPCDDEVIWLGFQNGELIYWSNEHIGTPNLYELLKEQTNLVCINNVYYDVRRRSGGNKEIFALLFIKDDFPYTNQYVVNRFNPALDVNVDEVDKIILYDKFCEGLPSVYNRDGERLFQVKSNVTYEDTVPNYFLLVLYLTFLYLLFYAYEVLLDCTSCLRHQLLYVISFFALLVVVRLLMVEYRFPYSLYSLPLFKTDSGVATFVFPVGELLTTMFCITHFLYISLHKVRIKYEDLRLIHYRHLFLIGFVIIAFLYTNFLHYAIGASIENTSISLNIAQFRNVNFFSVIVSFSLVLGGMGLFVLVDGSVRYFRHLFSFRAVGIWVTLVLLSCALLCSFFDILISPLECLFVWSLYFLFILNGYLVKKDVQKSVLTMALVVISIYIIFLAKSNEVHREMTIRAGYAAKLIKEKDLVFEKKLEEIDQLLKNTVVSDSLVKIKEQEEIKAWLLNDLIDLTGFHYGGEISLDCSLENVNPRGKKWRKDSCCYGELIEKHGRQVRGTAFYHIDIYDGQTTYIGRYVYPLESGELYLHIRFDSRIRGEGFGYPQILSKEEAEDQTVAYPYSYAKYKDGVLVYSRGDYNYYKYVAQFGRYDYGHVETINRDGYSHMMIPVGNTGIFVISLNDNVFSLYYLNVLYAVFLCVLFSSYGMFFRFRDEEWNVLKQETLKRRIKNNIISLVVALFVIMVAMGIFVNSLSVERQHERKVLSLLRYINKELVHLECVDMKKCPKIQDLLCGMTDMLWVDINIYDWHGKLTATSRPMIFEKGFDGNLLHPIAFQKIVGEGATSLVHWEKIGELNYMAAYMPLVLENGESYVLNIPYFMKNEEIMDLMLYVIIAVNIALIVMVLAFLLSGLVAERITKPLQLVNEKLRLMRFGGKNEKIAYDQHDEVGILVEGYNEMVDKLDDSVKKLAKFERESAWREMARQIAHEIKNPLTPMKLNIQFLQRTLYGGDVENVKKRFKDISSVLIEQIDHMASIASAFSDFAKMPVGNNEVFCLSDLVNGCVKLFANNVAHMSYEIEPDVYVYGDREQVNRVFVNLLKNAEQSIPDGRSGDIFVALTQKAEKVTVLFRDNGIGIPEKNKEHISEPNFTTKSGGMGLGLAMSYRIIESMGGSIYFESEEGKGTAFYVILDSVSR